MRDHDESTGDRDHVSRPKTVPDAPSHGLQRSIANDRPDALAPGDVAGLQRLAGNQGTGHLLRRGAPEESADEEGEAFTEERAAGSPVDDVLNRGGGSQLDDSVRQDMEGRFGQDFSSVRVHTGEDATASARAVQAHAYTVGDDIVFGSERYQPHSDEGRRTIAHELTHVVQQRSGPVEGTPGPGGVMVSSPDDRFEQEAEATADAIVRDQQPAPSDHATGASAATAPGPAQREVEGEEPSEEEAPEEDEQMPGVQRVALQRDAISDEEKPAALA